MKERNVNISESEYESAWDACVEMGVFSPELNEMRKEMKWADKRLDLPIEAPRNLPLFGQGAIKAQIQPFLKGGESFPHTLLLGEPGIGKTHMARWIASRRHEVFEEMLCPVGAENMPDWGIVLLDEAHRQARPEPLFEIMENHHVTVLAATTRPEKLEPAFRSRFFWTLHLKRYTDDEMEKMMRSRLPAGDLSLLASAAAGNPRQAERIIATAQRLHTLDPETVLSTCRINADGLTEVQLDYLAMLKRTGRPTGLDQLAVLVGVDSLTLKDVERLLLEKELIRLSTTGRVLTRLGKAYLEEQE